MQLQNALLRPCCALPLDLPRQRLKSCFAASINVADSFRAADDSCLLRAHHCAYASIAWIAGQNQSSLDLNGPSDWSCWLLIFRPGRRDIQLSEDLVDGVRITLVLTDCALVQGLDDVIAIRCSARLRGFRALRISLLNDSDDIGRTGCLLGPCLRELLAREDERGWGPEDGNRYEAMTDLSHRRTSDLYG